MGERKPAGRPNFDGWSRNDFIRHIHVVEAKAGVLDREIFEEFESEAEAEARGFAAGIEAAAREAEQHASACGHGFHGNPGRCIAEDIRALTPKREGT